MAHDIFHMHALGFQKARNKTHSQKNVVHIYEKMDWTKRMHAGVLSPFFSKNHLEPCYVRTRVSTTAGCSLAENKNHYGPKQ